MEKKILIAFTAIAVLFALAGCTTGEAVRCSNLPEITYFKVIGDSLSVNWEDTAASQGEPKYEVLVFQKKDDGTYDYSDVYRSQMTKQPYVSFREVADGTYTVKVRAKNDITCAVEWSEYTVSGEATKV